MEFYKIGCKIEIEDLAKDGHNVSNLMVVRTGEFRVPVVGEWVIWASDAYRVTLPCHLFGPQAIGKIVEVETTHKIVREL